MPHPLNPTNKPVLLTFSGTGQNMWTGYAIEVANRVADQWFVQPVNYGPGGIPAVWPMGRSAKSGVDEGVRLVLQEHHDAPFYGITGYSQGGGAAALLLDEFRHGRLAALGDRLAGGVTFGNPFREKGSYAGAVDPGGRGIADTRTVDTPAGWLDCVDPGDIYANVPDNAVGDDMTLIYRLVWLDDVGDVLALVAKLMRLLVSPLREFPSVVEALVRGIMFYGSKPRCAAHVEYHLRECPGTGMTYFEHAVQHLRQLGQQAAAA
ncbi:lysin B [Mycobacterium phage Patt]|uniref:Lysin B n=1 Tax=Mycobacterium phage Patt TaxID=2530139 RepID=A0A481VR64_9CAUD|nr:lysin B [Mycobacterium phage Patt]QBI96265.1 lysin B [Mycobacterium phage Patt]